MTVRILSCGHSPTPDSAPGTGYAYERDTDRTMCYACADDSERARMADENVRVVMAYVSTDGRTLTTWTGGTLARVTGHSVARTGWHRSEVHRYWARDARGQGWYGANAGPGMCINLRRVNTAPALPLPARVGPDSDGMLRPVEFSEKFGEILSYSSTRDDRVGTALTAREYFAFDYAAREYVRQPR